MERRFFVGRVGILPSPTTERFENAACRLLSAPDTRAIQSFFDIAEKVPTSLVLGFLELHYSALPELLRSELLARFYLANQQLLQARHEASNLLAAKQRSRNPDLHGSMVLALSIALNRRDLRQCRHWIRALEEAQPGPEDESRWEVLLNWYALCVHFLQRTELAAQAGMIANVARIEEIDPHLKYLTSEQACAYRLAHHEVRTRLVERLVRGLRGRAEHEQ